MSVTVPTYAASADGNIRASASLAAAGTDNDDLDYSAVFEGQIHVLNTPGGTVAATRGVRVDIYKRYGTGPTVAESPMISYYLPSATASTDESIDIFLSTGKYNIKITNLDAANAVTVEITDDKVASLTTT